MNTLIRWLTACWLSLAPALALAEIDATALVQAADKVRFPRDGFQVDVTITTKASDQAPEQRKYRVLSKGNDNTIVMTVAPQIDRGQMMLMKGRDLWWFSPDVSQPVRISVAQRLSGEVSNGDLARANFADDYDATLARTETLAGAEHAVIDLTAKDRGVTYRKVRYWVNTASRHPLKAEFFSISNTLLKTCSFEGFSELGGVTRPTRLVMEDALKKGEVSVLEYSNMRPRELPDHVFTKEYLKKLE
jgi:outer membrane lipoprotein-sorting protein